MGMYKGQVEFVVIVGLLVVISVAVLYAYQSGVINPSPVGTGEEQKLVRNSVENLIRDAVYATMKNISRYGGYLDSSDFSLDSVRFLGKEVPYWQENGLLSIPDIESNLKKGVLDYIKSNKDSIAIGLKKDINIGTPVIQNINLLNDKIVLTVNMPTTVQGYAVQQPYVVDVKTRFGEVVEFSRGFASYSTTNRPLEYYTVSSMFLSPIESGVHSVPFFIFLTRCGEFVYKSWYDIRPAVEYAIKVTLAHTYMPGKVPLNIMRTTSYPKYSLVPINGKNYENLEVSFHLPDNFKLEPYDFQFSPDPIIVESKVIQLVGACQSDPVYVNYFVRYPVIVRVKDTITGNVFQYALEVYIMDNKPGDWSSKTTEGYQEQNEICDNPQCSVDMSVSDSRGPVSSAAVTFMGCKLGETDSSGRLKGPAPCGIGPLEIRANGYEIYNKMQSSDNLDNLNVTISKIPTVKAHFFEVIVQNISLQGEYEVYKQGVVPLESDSVVYMNFYSNTKSQEYYQLAFDKKGGIIRGVPADSYAVSGTLMKGATEKGAFVTNYEITEDMDGEDVYVYLPNTIEYENIVNSSIKATAAVNLANVLSKCGLGPISNRAPKEFKGCTVSYDEI